MATGNYSEALDAIDHLQRDLSQNRSVASWDRAVEEDRMITRIEAIAQKSIGLLLIFCSLAHFLVSVEVM